ncbi:MAG: caspase family protein [Bacteroidota bacterium]|nr:caspase family protein [Bacteroidota bacterium]
MKNIISIILIFISIQINAQQVEIAPQIGHSTGIVMLEFSSDGKFIASVGENNKIIIWDVRLGKQISSIYYEESNYISRIYFDENNENLIGANYGEKKFMYNISSSKTTKISGNVSSKEPDLTDDISINSFILSREKKYKKISNNIEYKFKCFAVSEKNDLLVAGNEDTKVYVYKYSNGNKLALLHKHIADVNDVCFSKDQSMFATASDDRSILIWDSKDLSMIKRLYPRSFRAYSVDFYGDYRIAFGDEIGRIKIVDMYQGKFKIETFKPHDKKINDIEFSHNGKYVLTGGSDLKACITDIEKDEIIHTIPYHSGFKVWLDKNNPLSIYDQLFRIKTRESFTYDVNSVSFNDSDNLVAFGGTSYGKYLQDRIIVYDIETSKMKSKKLWNTGKAKIEYVQFITNDKMITRKDNNDFYKWKLGLMSTPVCESRETLNLYNLKRFDNDLGITYDFKSYAQYKGGISTIEKVNFKNDIVATAIGNDVEISNVNGYPNNVNTVLKGHTSFITDLDFNFSKNIIATTSYDASVKLWNIESGKLLATLYLVDNEKIVVMTPDNYYLAPNDALSGIGFKYGKQFFPPDQFDLKYNRPDIVLDRLGIVSDDLIKMYHKAYQKRLKKMGFTEDMLSDDFHLPTIEILNKNKISSETENNKVVLEISAEDTKYKLDRIKVWINNVAIYGHRGINLRMHDSKKFKLTIKTELTKGKNNIQISVLNQKGAESLKKSVEVFYKAPESKPNLYIVSIGTSKFIDSEFNLNFAAKDAKDLVSIYQTKNKLYENIYVKVLTNDQVTEANIKKTREFLEQAGRDDIVLLFIAGHGVLDENLDYFFATHDMDFENPKGKGIVYEDIEALLDGLKALKKIFFMDTCHSGELDKDEVERTSSSQSESGKITFRSAGVGVRQKEGVGLNNTSELMKEMFSDLRRGTGATVISSAGGAEYAMESRDWNNGLFTYCLLHGLKDEAADLNSDGTIMLSELQRYVQKQVSELSGGKQVPTSRIENLSMDFRVW